MKLQRILLLCSLTGVIGAVPFVYSAEAKSQASSSVVPNKQAVREPVIKLYEALNRIQQPQSGSHAQRSAVLLGVLQQSYDFPTVLANTVGYRYNAFSQSEKQALMNVFERFTVSRYLSNFAPDASTKFEILPEIKQAPIGNDQIVTTKIGPANDFASATEVDYLVRNTPQGWKIVDVLLNGHISQVALQHVDFSSSLADGGIQKLTGVLNQKIESASKNK